MADTTYTDGITLLTADTMNDLNRLHYTILSDPADAAAVKTALSLGTASNPQFATIELGHATDTTLSRVSAGTVAVEGVNVLTTATGAALAGSASQTFSAAAATAAAHAVRADQIQKQSVNFFATTNTSSAYILTPTPAITAYVDGHTFTIRPHVDCAAGASINISGIGARVIYRETAAGVAVLIKAGDLKQYRDYVISYSSALDAFTVRDCQTGAVHSDGLGAYTVSSSLTSSDFGRFSYAESASALTLTLPAASSGRAGSIITLYNLGAGLCTVARAGSDLIFARGIASATSLVLPQGSTIQLATNGSASWVEVVGNEIASYTTQTTPIPATGTAITASHSLGVIPADVQLEFICLTAEYNYSIGDIVEINGSWNGSILIPLNPYKTSSSVGAPLAATYEFFVANKTTGAATTPTKANWAYRFKLRSV